MKGNFYKKAAAFMLIGMLAATGCGSDATSSSEVRTLNADDASNVQSSEENKNAGLATPVAKGSTNESAASFAALVRPLLIGKMAASDTEKAEASVMPYSVSADLSDVANIERYSWLPDDIKELLTENLFAVGYMSGYEFYELYEKNRYNSLASFVTVDSMMHTYHLYFSYLLKNTEKNYLSDILYNLSCQMMSTSVEQYNEISDKEWKEAARRNVVFFAVGAKLQDESTAVPDTVADEVEEELALISSASGICTCQINGKDLDYTQFIPRGYYEGNEKLEKYFKAMMWYGQVGFFEDDDSLNKSAALMTLAINGDANSDWESLYTVTSFFAGASDDLTYYEYLPALESIYGKDLEVKDLEDKTLWEGFTALTDEMDAPAINSIPDSDGSNDSDNKGLRFMGQRFSIDEAVFQKLIYSNVGENSSGEKRTLPDTLDVAAALGSDTALEILTEQGDTDYTGYSENMEQLREELAKDDSERWSSSLYANWLYTLNPLLEEKEEGYPSFMLSKAWLKKNLESFAGSYTELKHDTVLYAKQAMAEMGGGVVTDIDDRGYVEPEVAVWSRFVNLSEKTMEGLDKYGLLSDSDRENLTKLTSLAQQLLTISEKELREETLLDEEYDLIRNYGGNIEHFWTEVNKEAADEAGTSLNTKEWPACVVADIASDGGGNCLEVGTGNPTMIYVIAPVDGKLQICTGTIYSFYQFKQPSSERMTDSEWREIIINNKSTIEQPAWTQEYRGVSSN